MKTFGDLEVGDELFFADKDNYLYTVSVRKYKIIGIEEAWNRDKTNTSGGMFVYIANQNSKSFEIKELVKSDEYDKRSIHRDDYRLEIFCNKEDVVSHLRQIRDILIMKYDELLNDYLK